MKAGIYLGKEQVEIQELPLPEVGDNDVLVQNLYSSICGTDVAVFTHGPNTGHKVTVGGEFGHETVSRIVKVGRMSQIFPWANGSTHTLVMPRETQNEPEPSAASRNTFSFQMQSGITPSMLWMSVSPISWQV